MGTGFTAPPQKDFNSCAALLSTQSGYFGQLDQWAGKECSQAQDLNGLLVLPIMELAPKIGGYFAGKLAQCQSGMASVSGKTKQIGQNYASNEHATSSTFAGFYGQPLPAFPDLGEIPGLSHLGDFDDEPIKLSEPDPAGDDTAKNISHQMMLLGFGTDSGSAGIQSGAGLTSGIPGLSGIGNFSGKILGMANKIFQYFTGQSLIQLIFQPVVGNWGRLKFLSDAYGQLSDSLYTVSGTMRKGGVKLAGEWTGDAATGFDSVMFRWSMGSGGLGDAAKVMAKAYKDGYDTACVLVQAALQLITRLVNNELKQLVETVAGDAAIETVGGGPEDPVADIVAGIWTAYKIYRIISAVITAVNAIIAIYEKIKAAIQKISSDVDAVIKAFESPLDLSGMVHSLINDVEQRGFEFEKDSGWNPELGAARIALLP